MRGRANRTRLAVLGIIGLLVVAWWVLVRYRFASSWGWWQPDPGAAVVDVPKQWRTDTASWVLLVAGVLVAVIGLVWLIRQVPSNPRARTYGISHEGDDGTSVLITDALGRAVEEQIEDFPGVSSALVRFFGARAVPEMMIQLDLDDRADIRTILGRIETEVVRDVEAALGARLSHVGIRLRTGAHVSNVGTTTVRTPVADEQLDTTGASLPSHPMPRPTFMVDSSKDRARPRTRDGRVLR